MNKKPPDQNQAGRMQHTDQLWTRGGRQCLDIVIIPPIALLSPLFEAGESSNIMVMAWKRS